MAKKRLPKSIRKYIRRQKAIIRRQVNDPQQREELIRKILKTFKK